MLLKMDKHDLRCVLEKGGRQKSDSLAFRKCVTFYTYIESMQWTNLRLLKHLISLK